MLNKFGELLELNPQNIHSAQSIAAELNDAEINERFGKFANQLKRVAPKASDFLYFSAVIMHAAEASALNPDGTPKLLKDGNPVKVGWEISPEGSWKWASNDPHLAPYSNANGDIFPEVELLKAYKKWVEKPLCIDHKSDSVDGIRGIILDTYYDRLNKRVIALAALDKVSYPELARGVQSRYKTSVSMGTRVGKAICYACGQVASTERDFCNHMRTKSSKEINIELDPIELSIVVNGADPQAKIRTILAAANNLRQNIDTKEQELNKLSLDQSSMKKFKELEDDLHKISDKLADLKANLEKDEDLNAADAPYGQTGSLAMKETELPDTDQSLNLPERFASNNNALRSELQDLKNSVNSKFQDMEKSLATLSHKIKEEIMSVNSNDGMNKKEGYFQGAGGANEPAPHQVKYPKEPTNEHLRNGEDKQMNTQDMGGVGDLHPGDKEKKQLVQRAEIEERAMRRAAALQQAKENVMKSKEAYFQGGGEGNEPTPGKPKYTKDPLNEKDRNKEDKQMVGQKPFPGVGDVDGLHPSPESADEKDELARKKLLQRASLKARFVRVASEDGSQDLGQSAWEVSRDGEVLFTTTVEEITGGNVEGLYDVVATKTYGEKLLERVYKQGADKVASSYKKAQAVSGMGALPASPADAGGAAPVPPMPDMGSMSAPEAAAPEAPEAAQDDSNGDPKEVAIRLAEKMRDDASDLLEAVRVLTGEQSEMGELEGLADKGASKEFRNSVQMKKVLNKALIVGMKKSIAELNDHQEELSLLVEVIGDEPADRQNATILQESILDGNAVVAQARELMSSVVKYARGSAQISKQAQALNMNQSDDMLHVEDMADVSEANVEDMNCVEDDKCEEDESAVEDEDMNDVMMDVDPNSLNGKKVEIKAADLSTKEARAEMRAKLAAQAIDFNPILDDAHALADGQTQLDVKPSGNLGLVETIEEKHKAMVDVAEAPPKVRKEAARLNQLIMEKKISASQLDALVAQGLDAEVVKYWKQFWGQAGKEGSEFASELLKEHAKAQIDEEIGAYKVKISRAYELTNEMVRRGLISDERSAISAQVEDIMTWNDEGFEAMKRMVTKSPVRKSASIPSVGMTGFGDPSAQAKPEVSLQDALEQHFNNRRF